MDFPIKNGDFPLLCLFTRGYAQSESSSRLITAGWSRANFLGDSVGSGGSGPGCEATPFAFRPFRPLPRPRPFLASPAVAFLAFWSLLFLAALVFLGLEESVDKELEPLEPLEPLESLEVCEELEELLDFDSSPVEGSLFRPLEELPDSDEHTKTCKCVIHRAQFMAYMV